MNITLLLCFSIDLQVLKGYFAGNFWNRQWIIIAISKKEVNLQPEMLLYRTRKYT
jgi:hypothetical protein